MKTEYLLVDLSSILHPIYAMSASEPDPNHCSQATVARVHALANGHPHVGICCDSGRSFRHEVDPSYKANRPERDEILIHQRTLAVETLQADGFPVWSVPGFEADDLIATVATCLLKRDPECQVVVVTGDKDLLQLVGERVQVKSVRDGSLVDPVSKFGVKPEQMLDYLSLVGDTSDNVKGAQGIGPKNAQALLAKFGTLDDLYRDLAAVGAAQLGLKPAATASLKEFDSRRAQVRKLIALRTDVPIALDALIAERTDPAAAQFAKDIEGEVVDTDASERQLPVSVETMNQVVDTVVSQMAAEPLASVAIPAPIARQEFAADQPKDLAVRQPEQALAPAPAEWERQLDPRSMREAQVLADNLHKSRLFSAYGTPQAVLSTVMMGRELGLPAMASLRGVHIIEGKHSLSAALMVALVLKSGLAEYFEPISFSATEATFETHRKGARNPVRITHTIDMARQAWSKSEDAWSKSGWGRNPTDMLVARATARLARMVYPDLLAGLYTPEELEEIRESREVAA